MKFTRTNIVFLVDERNYIILVVLSKNNYRIHIWIHARILNELLKNKKLFDILIRVSGPDEVSPRRLEYMQYVMHLPTDYYQNRNILFPLTDAEIDRGYG